MKVGELITELQKWPSDQEVQISWCDTFHRADGGIESDNLDHRTIYEVSEGPMDDNDNYVLTLSGVMERGTDTPTLYEKVAELVMADMGYTDVKRWRDTFVKRIKLAHDDRERRMAAWEAYRVTIR